MCSNAHPSRVFLILFQPKMPLKFHFKMKENLPISTKVYIIQKKVDGIFNVGYFKVSNF